jgi:hypothetical protein
VLCPVTKSSQNIETGLERFEKLETGYQKQILGEKRFELYRKGVNLDSFVSSRESEEFGVQHFIKSLSDFE